MSILKFTIPNDSKILRDLKKENSQDSIKFINSGSVCQNNKETIYTRLVRYNNEEVTKKIVYTKQGFNWGFKTVELVNH